MSADMAPCLQKFGEKPRAMCAGTACAACFRPVLGSKWRPRPGARTSHGRRAVSVISMSATGIYFRPSKLRDEEDADDVERVASYSGFFETYIEA